MRKKFKDAADFDRATKAYISSCVTLKLLPNIAGFCAANGFGRDTYYEYAKKNADTKKSFESAIEAVWVQRLGGPNATGAIFYLKNAFREDYKDRHETDITTKGEAIASSSELRELSEKFNEFMKSQ